MGMVEKGRHTQRRRYAASCVLSPNPIGQKLYIETAVYGLCNKLLFLYNGQYIPKNPKIAIVSCVFRINMPLDPKLLGQRMRQARERLGLSQDDFAALISRDQRAVSEYENGKRRITVTELPTIAKVLKVPLLYFFEGEVEVNDLDRVLLEAFHQLPNDVAQSSAIEILRLFNRALGTPSSDLSEDDLK
jgi:transcriptional regulator with XRE-family HTH domain